MIVAHPELFSYLFCVVFQSFQSLISVRTVGGVHTHEDNVKVTAPLAMVPKALDMLLDRMARAGFDFGRVVGIAGDAQVVFTNQRKK